MKEYFKNGIRITLITIVLIVGCEIGLRTFAPQLGENIYNNGIGLSTSDFKLGTLLAPKAMDIHYNREFYPDYKIEYRISEQGFRDEAVYDRRKPRNTLRILLLGDSFAFGIGNQYPKIWPVILENNLRSRGYAVEVIKAGIYGYDTRREVLYLKRLYPKYHPDIVIINFMLNDLFTNLPISDDAEEMYAANLKADSIMARFAATKASRLHILAWAKRLVVSSDILYSSLYMLSPRRHLFQSDSPELQRKLALTKRLFTEGIEYISETPAKLVVFSIPQYIQVINTKKNIDVDYVDRELARFMKRFGVQWVPARSILSNAYSKGGKDLYFRVDGHLNNLGNRVVGEYYAGELAKILQKLWWNSRVVKNQQLFMPYTS